MFKIKALPIPLLITTTSHGLRMSVNLVVVKMIAIFVGTAGMGSLGNFMSIVTMLSVFAGGGIGTAITKYVAEYQKRPIRMLRFIGVAIAYGLVFSLIVLIICVLFSEEIANALFKDINYSWLIPFIGVAQFLCFIGTSVISIINGQQRTDLFALITISAYLGALPIAYFLIAKFDMEGSVLALLLSISCTGFSALWIIARSRITRLIKCRFNTLDVKNLSKFSLMLIASATLFPLSEIFIRGLIIDHHGNQSAGLWQAMNRLSGAYIGFFTVFLATNYMPKLSKLENRNDIVLTVKKYLLITASVFCLFALTLYLLRQLIIKILFSNEFIEISDFLAWQLIGDFFKISAYVIGFLGVAKATTKIYISSELIQTTTYSGLSFITINTYKGNLAEISQSYAATYFIYFIIAAISFKIYSRRKYDIHC
jgi:O-antigen/teichoic acid export membrane protein